MINSEENLITYSGESRGTLGRSMIGKSQGKSPFSFNFTYHGCSETLLSYRSYLFVAFVRDALLTSKPLKCSLLELVLTFAKKRFKIRFAKTRSSE